MEEKIIFKAQGSLDVEKGIISAVVGNIDVPDDDDDIIAPGAIGTQSVIMSAYGHDVRLHRPPVGAGFVKEADDKAVYSGRVNREMDRGLETWKMLKFMHENEVPIEWSFGGKVIESEQIERDGKPYRLLKSIEIREVSPVLAGAGVETETLEVKEEKTETCECDAKLEKMAEQIRALELTKSVTETEETTAESMKDEALTDRAQYARLKSSRRTR